MKNTNPGFPLQGIFNFFNVHKTVIVPLLATTFIGSLLLEIPCRKFFNQCSLNQNIVSLTKDTFTKIITPAPAASLSAQLSSFATFVSLHKTVFFSLFKTMTIYGLIHILLMCLTIMISSCMHYRRRWNAISIKDGLRLMGVGSIVTIASGLFLFLVPFLTVVIGRSFLSISPAILFFSALIILIALLMPLIVYGALTPFIYYEQRLSFIESFYRSKELMKGNLIKFLIHRSIAIFLLGNLPVFLLNVVGKMTWGYSTIATLIIPIIVTTLCTYSFYKQLESPAITDHYL